MLLSEIQIRDPFVLPIEASQTYFLFGTTDKDPWNGPFAGFDCYSSQDLENWDGPIPAFRPSSDFWGTSHFWAPEVHFYQGRFWMLATFSAEGRHRATQALVSDAPQGPYVPWSAEPLTPAKWACLDGTLFVDEDACPWLVFCHEWQQIHDGAIYAVRLSYDFKAAVGEPLLLFHASQAPWVGSFNEHGREGDGPRTYVTDGPFLHRMPGGALLMLWSSFASTGYAMGIARSESGKVIGPWTHDPEPLWDEDGGHGMFFRTFDGRLFLTMHQPNNTPNERTMLKEVFEEYDTVKIKN